MPGSWGSRGTRWGTQVFVLKTITVTVGCDWWAAGLLLYFTIEGVSGGPSSIHQRLPELSEGQCQSLLTHRVRIKMQLSGGGIPSTRRDTCHVKPKGGMGEMREMGRGSPFWPLDQAFPSPSTPLDLPVPWASLIGVSESVISWVWLL